MWLFDSTMFMPRGHCGDWVPAFKFLYVMGNALTFSAYMAIPAGLFFLSFSWDKVAKSSKVRVLFSLFIVVCGLDHLEGVVSFEWPAYHFFAVWKCLVAAVSWLAVFGLVAERRRDG